MRRFAACPNLLQGGHESVLRHILGVGRTANEGERDRVCGTQEGPHQSSKRFWIPALGANHQRRRCLPAHQHCPYNKTGEAATALAPRCRGGETSGYDLEVTGRWWWW